MIISTLINIATTISISALNPTTIVFKDPIQFVSIGKTGDFSFYTTSNKKVIVIQPIKNITKTEMVVLTDNLNYQFKIHVNNQKTNNYYQVDKGRKNSSYTLLKRMNTYEVLEGATSIMIKNLSKEELIVNDEVIKSKSFIYLPKGGSVYVNEEQVI